MSNWFNAAGSTATPPSLLAQSAAYQPNPNPNTPQRNPQSNLFASSPGYYSNQHVRDTIPAADLNESQNLQNRYLESFTPGNKKKSSAVSRMLLELVARTNRTHILFLVTSRQRRLLLLRDLLVSQNHLGSGVTVSMAPGKC
jgi:hypothetical protein